MVAYQIYTPTFRDTDGDGVGDFSGIKGEGKLHEAEMGIFQKNWVNFVVSVSLLFGQHHC